MSKFSYKAVDRSGEHITGTLEAADRKSAVAVLTSQGHFVTELLEGAKKSNNKSLIPTIDFSQIKFGSRKVKGKEILAMTTQLSTASYPGKARDGAHRCP